MNLQRWQINFIKFSTFISGICIIVMTVRYITSKNYCPLSKSQFGQDILALKHHNYKRNGTYLEIGW